jgi:hypothetical protein
MSWPWHDHPPPQTKATSSSFTNETLVPTASPSASNSGQVAKINRAMSITMQANETQLRAATGETGRFKAVHAHE